MNVGERYSLGWKFPHRIECEVVELGPDTVTVESVHRCPPTCYVLQMRASLPIEGRVPFRYADFHKLFQRMSDGIPLPAHIA